MILEWDESDLQCRVWWKTDFYCDLSLKVECHGALRKYEEAAETRLRATVQQCSYFLWVWTGLSMWCVYWPAPDSACVRRPRRSEPDCSPVCPSEREPLRSGAGTLNICNTKREKEKRNLWSWLPEQLMSWTILQKCLMTIKPQTLVSVALMLISY